MDFSGVGKSFLVQHRGHVTAFPTRSDYLRLLQENGVGEQEFIENSELAEEAYLDWLRRGQVGCVFAQLLARAAGRKSAETKVLSQTADNAADARVLALAINDAFRGAVAAEHVEALSLLLPAIIQPEALVLLLKSLAELPDWRFESINPWRDVLVNVGLRARIESQTWAEILGMGPFATFLPPTRQCPVTSLEFRTKIERSIWSKIHPGKLRAAHLAQIPAEEFIGKHDFGKLFKVYTPALRLRVLGGNEDQRAKAHVTFSVPRIIWENTSVSQQEPNVVEG